MRSLHAGFVALLILGAAASATIATAQVAGTFTRAGDMTTARSNHTATLLPDGKVLIAGGDGLASAELFDPATGTFSRTGDMAVARRGHTATLLADGRVLIAGGGPAGEPVARAELYDYSTGTFTATGSMITPRGWHTAILLPNGKVMMVGGNGTAGYPTTAAAELYDPATGMFTASGSYVALGACDFCAPATLLSDGKVLFAGQYPAQLYDPVSDSFSPTGAMVDPDHSTATLLPTGKVLFAGGVDIGRSSSAELYDPATGTFTYTGSMASPRVWHSLSLLPNGMVLAAGGETDRCAAGSCFFDGSVASAELYDPSTGTFAATCSMLVPRGTHTATVLGDGRVLMAGGVAYGGIGIFFGSLASAELYNPRELVEVPVRPVFSATGLRASWVRRGRATAC